MEPATRQEMMDNLLPLHARDSCANVLIPLNACRRREAYMNWACHDEKHNYEVCLYQEYESRRKLKQEKLAAQK